MPARLDYQAVASDAHHESADRVLQRLQAGSEGLAETEAAARLEEAGPNRLPEPPRRGLAARFLSQFNNILIYVLLAAALVTTVLQHWVDTAVILAVTIVNAILGLIQEGRAEKAMEAIRGMLAPRAAVVRDGERRSISPEELVPGDVVLLESGDRVPADLRLIRTHGLAVQEAVLTGESMAVDKDTAPVAADAALGDRRCMAYSGTMVATGQAEGVVVATGTHTEIGRISGMLSEVQTLATPLVEQMDAFARWLTAFIVLVALGVLAYGTFVQDQPFAELFMVSVGLAVAAIPEGLPAVLTVTLAVGVQAMARHNAIVRRLPAIETLGCVSVICSDKTGTLTRNEMMVASITTAGDEITVTGSGYAPDGRFHINEAPVDANAHPVVQELGLAAALCNDSTLRNHEGEWFIEGDPMEGALHSFVRKAGLDERRARREWRRLDAIPFDAKHRFMAVLAHDGGERTLVAVKGAPEQVLNMCERQRTPDGGDEPIDITYWEERAESIAERGQRVLAFAAHRAPPDRRSISFDDVHHGLVLLGLVGFIDPPRPEAIAAVAECREAGIRVKMITGDHAGTAKAIGRQIGLENPHRVLTGAHIDAMGDSELAAAIPEADIFARTSPAHKLRLVAALQAQGLVVAMTGDGVNDAPALKRADAGIAMGRNGSEAAKEAAELVLADDNFASIAAAVRHGRTVYDNLKKVIGWTLPTNAGEAMAIIVAVLFGLSLPVTPVQILWVNLITAVTLGIALAFEPTEENTMRRPPRPRSEPLLTGGLAWQIVFVSALFLAGMFGVFTWGLHQGYSVELSRTLAVNTLVVMEIFYLFFMRNAYGTSVTWKAVRGTPAVWIAVGIATAAQFAVTYIPFLQQALGTRAVAFGDGLIVIVVGLAVFALTETEKQLRLRIIAMRQGTS
ncbi:MAG TPA: cation-transporting P-type ATPase [Arenicellales bacterium]|nr:cation-transporting P-type ATPase [Arenicellales bacterium]